MSRGGKHREQLQYVQDELAAMLFFLVSPLGGRRPEKVSSLRYRLDDHIRQLARLAEALQKRTLGPAFHCAACGKGITAGQFFASDAEDSVRMHQKCCGAPRKACSRVETRREANADLKRQIASARAYLKRRRLSA